MAPIFRQRLYPLVLGASVLLGPGTVAATAQVARLGAAAHAACKDGKAVTVWNEYRPGVEGRCLRTHEQLHLKQMGDNYCGTRGDGPVRVVPELFKLWECEATLAQMDCLLDAGKTGEAMAIGRKRKVLGCRQVHLLRADRGDASDSS